MASTSTPQDVQRANARLQQDPRPVSFFGKVKSYITAPFSWLMGTNEDTNDYEERDGAGKRKRSSMAPLESTEEEAVQYLGTKRAPIKRVKYQTNRISASLRQEPLSVSHSASTLTLYVYQCPAFRIYQCPAFRVYQCPAFRVYQCPAFRVRPRIGVIEARASIRLPFSFHTDPVCLYQRPAVRVYQ